MVHATYGYARARNDRYTLRKVHTFSHVFQGPGTYSCTGTGAGAMQHTCSIIVAPPTQYEFCPPRPLSVCHTFAPVSSSSHQPHSSSMPYVSSGSTVGTLMKVGLNPGLRNGASGRAAAQESLRNGACAPDPSFLNARDRL